MTPKTLRSAGALALAAGLLAGCSSSVNLILERRNFDRYQDMAAQARQRTADDQAFLDEALQQTSDEDLAPYPALQDQIEAMKRALATEAEDQARVEKFKANFDAFAGDRTQIDDKDPQWPRFQALESDFGAIAQALNVDFAQFNQAAQAYAALLQQYHVEKVKVSELEQALDQQSQAMQGSVQAMRERYRGIKRVYEDQRHGRTQLGGLQRRKELVDSMGDLLPGLALLSDSLRISAGQLAHSAQGQAVLWTGPGIAGGLAALLSDLRAGQDRFWKGQQDFEGLASQFDKTAEEEAAKEHEHAHGEGNGY